MILLAAALAALAAALVVPQVPHVRPRGTPRRPPPVVLLLPVAALAPAFLHGRRLVLVLLGLLTAAALQRLVSARRRAAEAGRRAERVREFCEAVAADLAVGQPPHRVLDRVCGELPEFAPVATAARLGSDVPEALRRLARAPGGDDLRLVAAAWQVAHRSGAGLAAALEQVAGTVRERRRTTRLVAAELASAHATARMMAVLPILFVLGGSGLGGDPVGFLTGSTPGVVCLAVGLALTYAGLAWLQRISDRVLS